MGHHICYNVITKDKEGTKPMTFDYTILNTIFSILVSLGYDVQLVPCNDGLKVESISEGWDFAINSGTEGYRSGLVEFYSRFCCVGCLDAKEAIKLVLSL